MADSFHDMMLAAGAAREKGDPGRAAGLFGQALERRPGNLAAAQARAECLGEAGQWEDAAVAWREVCGLLPGSAGPFLQLAAALGRAGRVPEAEKAHLRAVELEPGWPGAWLELGDFYRRHWQYRPALAAYRRALRLEPDGAQTRASLGALFMRLGRPDLAERHLARAAALAPKAPAPAGLRLTNLNYLPVAGQEQIRELSRAWAARFTLRTPGRPPRQPLDGRRLRLAYLSGDFRNHPVSHFLSGVLKDHDRGLFELFLYASNFKPGENGDAVTGRLRGLADHWRPIGHLSDPAARELMFRDKPDVLVDLSGHTTGNRLQLLALKPAPLVITWLGYSGTLCLPEVDFLLADGFAVPPGAQAGYCEKIFRPSPVFCCFTPPPWDLPLAPPPALARGAATFGCFQNLAKLNPEVTGLWARVLRQAPNSRLLLKDRGFQQEWCRNLFRARFRRAGVDPDRLEFLAHGNRRNNYLDYGRVDISLDPFPHGGTTSAADALWMGVPVVTLAGDRFVGRMVGSVVRALGHPEWAAESPEQYMAVAAGLAADLPALASLRAGLRQRLLASPFGDAKRFTGRLEQGILRLLSEMK